MKSQDDSHPPILTEMISLTLRALEALMHAARYLHPPTIPTLAEGLKDIYAELREGLEALRALDRANTGGRVRSQIELAAAETYHALEAFTKAASRPQPILAAYGSLSLAMSALESLYVLAPLEVSVSAFFLEPDFRRDREVLDNLSMASSKGGVGIIHASNERGTRGGFSLYVPEYYAPERCHPLIVALHGGRGHGADFLWTWLREARGRGCILVSPTSTGETWSLTEPRIDSNNIDGIVDYVGSRWNIDPTRVLLTGLSDGGTFTYLHGLCSESPYTHLAPSSATFHPSLLDACSEKRLRGLPVYLTHGALDWMFSVQVAREARAALGAKGAHVVYREVRDLSHTYSQDENPRIMDWFLARGGGNRVR